MELRKERADRAQAESLERPPFHDVFEAFSVRFTGMVAEADLRGMTPLAVFFEWLDELGEVDQELATAIIVALSIPTRIEYRRWREGSGNATAGC